MITATPSPRLVVRVLSIGVLALAASGLSARPASAQEIGYAVTEGSLRDEPRIVAYGLRAVAPMSFVGGGFRMYVASAAPVAPDLSAGEVRLRGALRYRRGRRVTTVSGWRVQLGSRAVTARITGHGRMTLARWRSSDVDVEGNSMRPQIRLSLTPRARLTLRARMRRIRPLPSNLLGRIALDLEYLAPID
jgi:hypothetical protein